MTDQSNRKKPRVTSLVKHPVTRLREATRGVYEDKNRQEDIVRASGLDWVLVRPMVLNDKPGTGVVQALTDLSDVHGGTIGRSDVARFVVDQLTNDQSLRRAPLIRG